MPAPYDVRVTRDGSLFLFQPLTDEAGAWLRARTDGTWTGEAKVLGPALVVEHRYAHDLALGLAEAGFTLGPRVQFAETHPLSSADSLTPQSRRIP